MSQGVGTGQSLKAERDLGLWREKGGMPWTEDTKSTKAHLRHTGMVKEASVDRH